MEELRALESYKKHYMSTQIRMFAHVWLRKVSNGPRAVLYGAVRCFAASYEAASGRRSNRRTVLVRRPSRPRRAERPPLIVTLLCLVSDVTGIRVLGGCVKSKVRIYLPTEAR